MKILKTLLLSLVALVLLALLLLTSLYGYFQWRNSQPFGKMETPVQPGEVGQYVAPFIGTGGYFWVCGNNFPGASVPFGEMRLSPDTWSTVFRKEAMNTAGYYFPDNRIIGFSHTRLSGTGATDGGHFRMIPAIGENGWTDYLDRKYARFSHEQERGFPGYYAVRLEQPAVLAELTCASRTGLHRYTFSQGTPPHLLLDICSVLGDKEADPGHVTIHAEKNELEGEVKTYGTFASRFGGIQVYFCLQFDQPFSQATIWRNRENLGNAASGSGKGLGVDLAFLPDKGPIVARLAISHVSLANARMNLESESGGKRFEQMAEEAKNRWEEKLSLVKANIPDEEKRVIFYTALYRSFQMPTLFQDVNGEYIGFDKQVHKAEGYQYYTDLSLWDTFRTLHSLYMLVAPSEQRDMLVSLVKMKEQGGGLPRWPSGYGYTGSMLGSPADMVISESYQKGIRDFDVKSAYESMKFLALHPRPKDKHMDSKDGIAEYNQYGYCPTDLMERAVSRTLEYAWADKAIALLADSLGYADDARLFYQHALNYRNVWNPATKYFQSRDTRGKFTESFNPLKLSYFDSQGKYTKDYVEGSGLQWRFAVPFDPEGLINLFGGNEPFVAELNDFFEKSDPSMSSWNPGSYYWHGNEPDIHAAYLFNEAGRPDLTQKWSSWILDHKYAVCADGIDGNDDGATLSSWYIFASMGFYPIAGTEWYELGAPAFNRALLKVGQGKTLVIETENFSGENRYVSEVWLNGQRIFGNKLHHRQIANGGNLKFVMSHLPVITRY
ncbi:MAG: GH92 family glycosyl hydrolase [Marinilabiliales bacterium]|nr:GH92 family glycosyl hydrolase [Marinilabiliales bacterium]